MAGATSGRPLRTFEMVGVDTPARCAICWSVMRFGRAFTPQPFRWPGSRIKCAILPPALLPKIDILIAGKYPTTGCVDTLAAVRGGAPVSQSLRKVLDGGHVWRHAPWARHRWGTAPPYPARVKFTNGYWLLREGVQARYPTQAYDVTLESDALVVYAPTERIRHRGDTLNQPLLTVRCSSPAPDVISVKISHFLGEKPRLPEFSLNSDPSAQVYTELDDNHATITAGALSARFERGEGWALQFLAGEQTADEQWQ